MTQHDAPPLSDGGAATLKTIDAYGELRYPNRHHPAEVGTDDWAGVKTFIDELLRTMPLSLKEALEKVSAGHKSGRVLMEKRIGKPGN